MLENIIVAIMCAIVIGATAFGLRTERGDNSGKSKRKHYYGKKTPDNSSGKKTDRKD